MCMCAAATAQYACSVRPQVVGTEQSALASVVAADVELMALREEEAEINRWGRGSPGAIVFQKVGQFP